MTKPTQRELMFFVAGILFPSLDFIYVSPLSGRHPFTSGWTFWTTMLMTVLCFLLLKRAGDQ
jgi:hypothetical protein